MHIESSPGYSPAQTRATAPPHGPLAPWTRVTDAHAAGDVPALLAETVSRYISVSPGQGGTSPREVTLRPPSATVKIADIERALAEADDAVTVPAAKKIFGDDRVMLLNMFIHLLQDARVAAREMESAAMRMQVTASKLVQAAIIEAPKKEFAAALVVGLTAFAIQAGGAMKMARGHSINASSGRRNEMSGARKTRTSSELGGISARKAPLTKTELRKSPDVDRGGTEPAAPLRQQPLSTNQPDDAALSSAPVTTTPAPTSGSAPARPVPADAPAVPKEHEAALEEPKRDLTEQANHQVAGSHISNAVAGTQILYGQLINAAGMAVNGLSQSVAAMAGSETRAGMEQDRLNAEIAVDLKKTASDTAASDAAAISEVKRDVSAILASLAAATNRGIDAV